ncbi:hypothetical protein CVT24_010048, partial [Panaeolus cyanescens]
MSVNPTSLSDSLSSTVPKLDPSGKNWAIFKVRFQDAVEGKGTWGHFDGTEKCPVVAADAKPSADETAAIEKWNRDERSAKALLTQKLPDATLMKVHALKTVRERWEKIEEEYTKLGTYAQTELRQQFLDMHCTNRAKVREFLNDLRIKRQEVAAVGVDISEDDYRSTILQSLPASLSNFALTQIAAARLLAPTVKIDPDILMGLIIEESNRQKTQRSRRNKEKSSKGEDGDEAMMAESSKSKGRKRRKGGDWKTRAVCWNCQEKGHIKDDCHIGKSQ